jgi:predicted  nucleic acid-binding Zn-ribbon protein
MTPQTRTSLRELQELDQEIKNVRSASQSFDQVLEEVDAPVLRLEQDVQALGKRLTEIKLEENRLELTIEERRIRAKKLQERMEAVRNVREEAAVHAELEMVRRALESEEQEALSLLDQMKRLEERHEEQEAAYQEALAEVGPRREELVKEQQDSENKLEALQAERNAFAEGIDQDERRIYESIMAGARDVALAELTQDGACGNCYNMVPLQIQNQIRHTDTMFRCEGCGVILTPESPEGLARAQEEGERIELALKASTDQRDLERAAVSESEALEAAEEAAVETPAEAAVETAEEAAVEEVDEDSADAVLGAMLGKEGTGVGEGAGDEVDADEVPTKGLIFADLIPDEPPAKAEVEAEAEVEVEVEVEAVAEVDVEAEVVAEVEVEAEAEVVAEVEVEAEAEVVAEVEVEAEAEAEAEAEVEVEAEVEAEAEVEVEAVADVEVVAEEEGGAEEAEPQEKPAADA